MAATKNNTNDFSQPFGHFTERKLTTQDIEKIDYLPGYSYRIWHNDTDQGFPNHKHPALEIILCAKESYSITIKEETFKLHEGDIIFIPPMEEHFIQAPEGGERFILLFDVAFFDYFHSQDQVLDYFSHPKVLGINNASHLYPFVYSGINKIIQLYFKNEEMNELEIYSELLKICRLMCNSTEETGKEETSTHSEIYDKFVRVLSYIETNYAEDMSLESVAKTAGFSKYHFSRLFKQYTDTTFYDYLCTKRIMVAKKLLLTNIPVTDVAFQTGFNNLTTFCRCFKKYTGYSPSSFKNNHSGIEHIRPEDIASSYHSIDEGLENQ